jgi:hypothetical protein
LHFQTAMTSPERVHLQPGAVDPDQVHELRVPVVVARVRLVHRPLFHVVYSWVHGLPVARHPRDQDGGMALYIL